MKTISLILVALGFTTLIAFQNCARIGNLDESSINGKPIDTTSFSCTLGENRACEIAGQPGTMTCISGADGNGVWGNCVTEDDDNDGVKNSDDQCPGTPQGTVVGANGCPFTDDDDNDGVKNSDDQCPGTPQGTVVGANGCPLSNDDDGDGVLNPNDLCPGTPLGSTVDATGCRINQTASCSFGGNTYVHGQSFVAYFSNQAPAGQSCIPELRTCVNGTITGSYQHLSCSQDTGDCSLGGQSVANGQSIDAYSTSSVAYGQDCQKQSRVCVNGSLSGNYSHLSCVVSPPSNCMVDGQVVAHGDSVMAFQSTSVAFGQSCVSQSRSCVNGNLSGSYQHLSCQVQAPLACKLNNVDVPHGGFIWAYSKSMVPFGSNCSSISEKRSCNNGALSGSYAYSSCKVEDAKNCTFNNKSLAHGSSVTAFSTSMVPFGSKCQSVSETRTCTNGNLSGSHPYADCSVTPAKSCSFNGQTIAHGASVAAYLYTSVAFGQSCSSSKQNRVCNNGSLSGTYKYSSCSVRPAVACTFNGQSVAHGASVTAYRESEVNLPAKCTTQTRTCSNGSMSGTYAYPSCQENELRAARCTMYYQLRGGKKYSNIAANGAWAKYHSDANYDCRDTPGCGIRFGLNCVGDPSVQLSYQFKSFSTASPEQKTPWSLNNGGVQWGAWSNLRQNHPESECRIPYKCGLRVKAEVQDGLPCTVSYRYKTDKGVYSPYRTNGVWSELSRSSSQGDNCDDNNCGITATLSCGGTSTYTPPGGGGGGGGNFNPDVNLVQKDSAPRGIASTVEGEGFVAKVKSWWSSVVDTIYGVFGW